MGTIKISIKKRGIFFTFIAITIMTVFILVFTPQADISLKKDMQSVASRISSIDNYVDDLENNYFETILRATAYKTILSLIFYMNSTGSYIATLDSAFSEVMMTGKINGVPIDSITGKKIMNNNTLTDWSKRIIDAAEDTLNVNTTINVSGVSVFQTKPWNIDSSMSVNFTVKSNVAEWKKSAVITATISIEGLHDPYYLVNTNKAYTNQIKKSTVEFNQWNIAKLREHLRNGTYVHWENSDAPSFLMRFTNTISSSNCCGIESMVNPNKITPSDQRESYADYFFWQHKFANNCTQLYNITGLWDEFRYFKLDFDHVTRYNITAQDAVRSC
ncbi:hypothetical protein J4448_02070 [Candidatus Woesearchaeota archaeon]|nr:hypothetical protein [Candidatus Woesearchaeota archaeon]